MSCPDDVKCSDYGECPDGRYTVCTNNLIIYGVIEGGFYSRTTKDLSKYKVNLKIWFMTPYLGKVDIALFSDRHGKNQGLLHYEDVSSEGVNDPGVLDLVFNFKRDSYQGLIDRKIYYKDYVLESVTIKSLSVAIGSDFNNINIKNLKLTMGFDFDGNLYFYAPVPKDWGNCYCSGRKDKYGIIGVPEVVGSPGYEYQ